MPTDKSCIHLHLLKGEVKVLKWHLGESSGFEQGRKCSRGFSRKEEREKQGMLAREAALLPSDLVAAWVCRVKCQEANAKCWMLGQLQRRQASDLIKAKWQDGGTGCEMYAAGRYRAQKSVYSVFICTKCNRQKQCWMMIFSVGGWWLEGNIEEGLEGVDNCLFLEAGACYM